MKRALAFLLFLLCLCVVLVGTWQMWLHSHSAPRLSFGEPGRFAVEPFERRKLKVFVLNSFFLPAPAHWGSHASARARVLVEQVQRRGVDIVMLSETFDTATAAQIGEGLRHTHPYQRVSLPEQTLWRINGGLSVFSRYPVVDWGVVEFDACARVDCLANKGLLWLKINTPQGSVWVVNTHMDSGKGAANEKARARQLEQLGALLASFPRQAPVIFGGDTNVDGMRHDAREYRSLARALPGYWDAGLLSTDPLNTLNCDTTIWCEHSPNTNLALAERLDYIFVRSSPEWQLDAVHHLSYPEPVTGVPYLSDHHAVEATVTFTWGQYANKRKE